MIVTIISGASRGIGAAIIKDLKNLDHTFILLSRHTDIKTDIGYHKKIDLEDYNQVYQFIKYFLADLDNVTQINIILCAAQIGSYNSPAMKDMEDLYKSNVIGNFAIIKASLLFNIRTIRIVFFAGGGAAFAYPDFFAYSLTKVAVVRAVENLSIIIRRVTEDSSIIALAPGAVDTDMLKKVISCGSEIRTKTDITEPVNFVRKFITDEIDSLSLNGMFIHVRDDLSKVKDNPEIFKLRRIQ
jgi:benzil reductase ((S)-benzoin forming)